MPGGSLWMRNEINPNEERAPISPDDARTLIAGGTAITVEDSPQRIFPTAGYAAAGCRIVEPGSWPDAPDDEVIIGLKAPGEQSFALRHRHVFFGHAYKGQLGGDILLRRFAEGGGSLLDLECLTDDSGRRVAAFGYWAGYVGAALAALHARGQLVAPLRSMSQPDLDTALEKSAGEAGGVLTSAKTRLRLRSHWEAEGVLTSAKARLRLRSPGEAGDDVRALVVGALGRCGRGARAALSVAGIATTGWDLAETRNGLDRDAILGHDVLINTVLTDRPAPAFVRPVDVTDPARSLSVISDVTCDVTSDCNLLPIYDRPTDWAAPVRRLRDEPPLDLIAIDNLPSLLPREASTAFSADLLPHLRTLERGSPVWQRALDQFKAVSA